ncbi:MAG: alpha-L-rhamnosidase [Halioglobus sp.]|nr:alpha-L-rhamnosidase [Halioglobus sp.]
MVLVALAISAPALAAPTHLVDEPPRHIEEVEPGVFLVDFGRVAFGNLRLTAPDGSRARVRVHFGEALREERVDRQPPGTVRYRDTGATLEGGVPKVVAPGRDARNTSDGDADDPPAVLTPAQWDVLIPFRWVEISGFPGRLQAQHIARRAAYLRAWRDDAATFTSSDELLNRVWELSRYSIKATSFAGIYVDGDRERIPYEGDAYLNQLSHYYTDNDRQMARDTFDYLMRYPTWPTEWASHMIFMAYADWMHTGDRQWLAQRYDALRQKLLLQRARADGLVTSDAGHIDKGDLVDWPPDERDGYVLSPVNTVVNAFHLRTLELMARMAAALGHAEDAARFRADYRRTLVAFQAAFYTPETGLYRDGLDIDHSSLHANLFPLAFGLVPPGQRADIAAWLAQRGMRCSVYAAQYLLEGLFENGAGARALELITAPGDRSWRHMLDSGATITWEAWDARYKPNLDWNHAWGAAPANLLPRYILGAEPLAPGWESVRIRPVPGNLAHASGKVPTVRGPIRVDWQRGGTFQLALRLPVGVRAVIELPADSASATVTVNGETANARRVGDRWVLDAMVQGDVKVEVVGD